jgi:hypothetical protein
LEGEEVLDVVEDGFALLDSVEDGREVVVGQDHVGGFLGDIGAVHAHGNANVGLFESWRIVDAVARHGNNIAAGLERPDDFELVVGICSCENGGVLHCPCQVLVRHGIDFITAEDRSDGNLVRRMRGGCCNRHAQLLADSDSCGLGIASNHYNLDTPAHQLPDGASDARSRRIAHADQTGEAKAFVLLLDAMMNGAISPVRTRSVAPSRRLVVPESRDRPAGKSQNSKTRGRHLLGRLQSLLSPRRIQHNLPAIFRDVGIASIEDFVNGPFHVRKLLVVLAAFRTNRDAHPLALGAEWGFGDPGTDGITDIMLLESI